MATRNDSKAAKKSASELHDEIAERLTKARAICYLTAYTDDDAVPQEEIANAMWAAQDLIEEAKEYVEDLARRAA